MALTLFQEGAVALWRQMASQYSIGTWSLHLLGSNYNPLHTDTYTTLLPHEMPGGTTGYVPFPELPVASWEFSFIPQGAQAQLPVAFFNLLIPLTVYGYFLSVTYLPTPTAVWGELFQAPYVFDPAHGPFFVSLNPQLISIP